MNSKVYKWCAVPQCKNTSKKSPNKVFVYVPNKKIIRSKWLKLARRNPNDVATNSPIYFCEDHFDLQNDMENYMQYHVMGSVSQVRMKPGCMPHKFICQPGRKTRTSDTAKRPYIAKKRRMMIIEECKKEFEEKHIVTEQSSCEKIASGSSVQQNVEEIPQLTPRVLDKLIQEDPAPSTSDVTVKEEQNDEYNGLAPSSPDIAVKEEDNDEEDPLASCPSPSGLSDIGSEELEGALDTPTIINLRQLIKDLRSQLKQKDETIQSLQENEAVTDLYGIIKCLQETVAEKDRIIKSVEDTNSRLLEKNNALKSVLTTIKNKLAAAKHKKCR